MASYITDLCFTLFLSISNLTPRSMEIEKQIALDNDNLTFFRKKWVTFKQCPEKNNLIYTAKQGASEKRADGGWRAKNQAPSRDCYIICSIFVSGLCLFISFYFTFFAFCKNSYLF